MSLIKFYMVMFQYQKKQPLLLAILFLTVILSVTYLCVQPLIFQWLINDVLISKNPTLLIMAISFLALNYIIFVCTFLMRIKILAKMGAEIMAEIRLKLFTTIQNLNLNDYYKKKSAPLISYFSEHISLLESTTLYQTWSVFADVVICIVSGALLFYFNWVISLVILPILLIILVMPRYFSKKSDHTLAGKQDEDRELLDSVQESIVMNDVIRLGLLKDLKKEQFQQSINKSIKANYGYNINLGYTSITLLFGINFAMFLITSLGSILVFMQMLTLGSFVGFLMLFRNFLIAVDGITTSLPVFMRCASSLALIENLLAENPQNHEKTMRLPDLKNQIAFHDVLFNYDNRAALKNINLTLKAGEFIGIVGLSGSGKSTFLKLLLKELQPTAGTIHFDEKNYMDFGEAALLRQISVVMQEPKLFEMSILDNIRMGRLDATNEQIFEAAEKAGIHNEIQQFPEQYNTIVGQKKSGLSGGQAQRICIARALIARPTILCLDEASSALDPFAAELIENTLNDLIGIHTIISITHRLKSVTNADLIVVMNQGEIVETGTHDSLMNQKEFYYELWSKQNGFTLKPEQGFVDVKPTWLKKIPLFEDFDETMLKVLSESLVTEKIDRHEIIFKHGDHADKFYIIASGKVDVISCDNIHKALLSDGDFFGEVALLYDCKRNATVITNSTCLLVSLGGDVFYKIIKNLPEKQQQYLLNKAKERLTDDQKNINYSPRLIL